MEMSPRCWRPGMGVDAAAFDPFGVEAKGVLSMAMMINHIYCPKEGKTEKFGW